MDRRIPVIVSEGNPFARGLHLGYSEARRIRHTVRAYRTIFQQYAGLRHEDVLLHAERFMPAIAEAAPALLEEMRGIAEGSSCDLREIVAINARTELMYGVRRLAECTTVGVIAAASADGHARLAQNWDWIPALAGTTIVWVVRREEGPDVLTLTEAGIVGKIGMNAAGLVMCINLLNADSDFAGPAIPMHVILRSILDKARTVGDAITLLEETKRCTSCNHLIMDAEGKLVDVEATPGGQHVLQPVERVLTHTNHCVGTALVAGDLRLREEPETLVRGERIYMLAHAQLIDEGYLRTMLSDHATAPNSICLHVNAEEAVERQAESIASVIFDLTAGTVDIAEGPPCEHPYRCLKVEDYLRRGE